jgi:diaminobutyrate-2-oxoglutarate transaminase
MCVIGIAGGTGGGKTTALDAVRALGGEVLDCDAIYHRLLAEDPGLLGEIGSAFPGTVRDGKLDRKKLGAQVFGDPEKLERLNAITHRYVVGECEWLLKQAEAEGKTLAAIDAIGLIESGLGDLCRVTAAVIAPLEDRVKRLMAREGITEEYARLRIGAQKSDAWFRDHCDLTLENRGSREEFLEACKQRFEALRKEDRRMDTSIFERRESGVRSYCRSFPAEFVRAKMSRMYDAEGREYLDFFNGAGALNYGHNNDYIKARILDYLEKDGISHALDMYTGAKADFLRTFEEKILVPGGLDYKVMFSGPTGTNAVGAALKLARKVTGRTGVFALTGAFHGMTAGALAVTSGAYHRHGAHMPLNYTTFVPHPNSVEFDTIAYYEYLMTDEYSGVDKPAAIIIETTQAEGGIHVASNEWLRALRQLCDRQGVLLIVDDIQVGCGRTGPFLSFQRAGIVPDLVTLSKSISGYGLPMSLLLIKPEHDQFLPAEHNGTFRGNQLAFVGAKAALEYREQADLEKQTGEKAAQIADFIRTRLLPMDERLTTRGLGLIQGVDFSKVGEVCGKVQNECFQRGLIIERCGPQDCVLKLMPALTITPEELNEGLEIIEAAMKAVL